MSNGPEKPPPSHSVDADSQPSLTDAEIAANQRELFDRLGVGGRRIPASSLREQMPWIDAEIQASFEDGGGKEISSGKILDPISSAALAVNFFAAWKPQIPDLGAKLGAPWVDRMRFEVQFPTGLPGTNPTLDVVLDGGDGPVIAIEAKFTEPYYHRRPANTFRPSYFESDPLWEGLPHLREMALALTSGELKYEFLHAAQLIKHALGLSRAHKTYGFSLKYVWFDGADAVSEAHRSEIEDFTLLASQDIHFTAVDYRALASLSARPRSPAMPNSSKEGTSLQSSKSPTASAHYRRWPDRPWLRGARSTRHSASSIQPWS